MYVASLRLQSHHISAAAATGLPANDMHYFCPNTTGNCYFVNQTTASFGTHRNACKALGGDLVSWNSRQEQVLAEISLNLKSQGNTWIGVLRAGNNWYLAGTSL